MSEEVDPFVEHRSLLFTVAYEMLGSAADAEDVVQDTWLRWREVDVATVLDPRSYLVRIATRQALNRMRSLSRPRETYVGPWLPEPLSTGPDVAEQVELADAVSTAMLVVLETLAPVERAVFCLREVFGVEYAEIAEAVEKSPAAVRQIAHRARGRVRESRPRSVVDRTEYEAAMASFVAATATGDVQSLLDVLAPDVVFIADGGGQRSAALRPIHGREKVLRFMAGIHSSVEDAEVEATVGDVNGRPGLHVWVDGVLETVMSMRVDQGRVSAVYAMRNPEKLKRVGSVVAVRR